MFAKCFTCNTQLGTDCEGSQDDKSAREELGAWKVEINWNNCYSNEYATDITDILDDNWQNQWIFSDFTEYSVLFRCPKLRL